MEDKNTTKWFKAQEAKHKITHLPTYHHRYWFQAKSDHFYLETAQPSKYQGSYHINNLSSMLFCGISKVNIFQNSGWSLKNNVVSLHWSEYKPNSVKALDTFCSIVWPKCKSFTNKAPHCRLHDIFSLTNYMREICRIIWTKSDVKSVDTIEALFCHIL